MNELHVAARYGSVERAVAVLSWGVIDIDEGTPDGFTPLMFAAQLGHSHISQILLTKGANVSIVNGHGWTALHLSAQVGHLAVTKLLMKAGADLEAKISATGATPLQLAAEQGHSEIMTVLIEAGANPNSRGLDGSTPLYAVAAAYRHMDALKVLLRAKANPLLAYSSPSGATWAPLPLDAAAGNGHLEVARELIQEHGIEGCGGANGGMCALEAAARHQQVEILELLTSAGVVDTGSALFTAANSGRESSVKFLLQQQEWRASGEGSAYLNTRNNIYGATPLLCSILAPHSCSPRITRMLVDAGAYTTTAVRLSDAGGVVFFNGTPLALADYFLRKKSIGGKDATEEQLNSLKATWRLLMRVEAVHAVSWLWASDVPSATHAAAKRTGRATGVTPTPLMLMLPVLRRRARRPRVLLAALFRSSNKP